jgi:dihydroorotate dehydrogenase electron transfer subunit
MLKQPIDCTILENTKIANNIYKIRLTCENTNWIKPGKFVNLQIPGVYLRRPLAICEYDKNSFTLVYLLVGEGTKILSQLEVGKSINTLIDLGNEFELPRQTKQLVLVSGGVGFAPLICLANQLKSKKIKFEMIVGFTNKNDVCYVNEIKKLCPNAHICTDDGSYGEKGNVIDIAKKHNLLNHYYFCCGSTNMMKVIFKNFKEGQLSLESRMGCGFGACMGCSIKTKKGEKRICCDGPIFESKDLL